MGLLGRLFGTVKPDSLDREIRAEQEHHMELAAREMESRGVPREEAVRAARMRFGSETLAYEDTRRQDLLGWLDDFTRELRIAARALRHSPSYAVVVVLAMGLGIGANTAIFSLVHSVLFRALPYPEPDQLAFVFTQLPNGRRSWANYEDLQDWKRDSRTFQQMSAWVSQTVNLTGTGEPDRLRGGFVSHDFFSTLGVQPMGRAFLPEEMVVNGPRVAIASWGLWQERFGGNPGFLHSKVNLNGEPYTIVGILPKDFDFPIDKIDVWIPLHAWPAYTPGRDHFNCAAIGRMRPGVTLAAAKEEMDARVKALAAQYPETNRERVATEIASLREMVVEDLRPMVQVLAIAVLLALLVACANIATLTVSRVLSRSRELGIRAALGAGRGRLLVHLFSEQVLLCCIGAGLGLLLAYWFTRLAVIGDYLPALLSPRVDWRVALAGLCLAVMTALLTGPLPAIPLLRGRSFPVSGSARGSSETAAANRTRRVLVTLSIAVSVILLTGAGLFVRSFQTLANVDPGFRTERLLTMEYRMPQTKYPQKERQADFHRRVAEEASRVPGVRSATVMMALPFSGNGSFSPFEVVGQTPPAKGSEPRAQVNRVDPAYFATMGIPLLQGRGIQAADRLGTDLVVVVSQSMAQRCWPGQNPMGRSLLIRSFDEKPMTVVGVVGDSKHNNLEEESRDKAYLAFAQHPHIFGTLAVRTAGDAGAYARAVQQAVWTVDKDQPVWKVRTMETLIDSSMAGRRILARLTGAFSLFALLLAAIGLYGVISYATTRRARELSIRAAMGATRAGLVRLVLGQGLQNIGIGLLLGLSGAIPAARLLADQLFQVKPTDPAAYALAVSVLAGAAILATVLPARRAARINPAEVLRQD